MPGRRGPSDEMQQEKIHQLVEVCGIEEQAARHLLEASQWNVEEALHLHFAEGQANSSGSRPEQPLLGNGYAAVGSTPEAPPQESRSFLDSLSKAWTMAHQAVLGVASEDFQQWFQERFQDPTPNFCKASFGDAVTHALVQRRLLMAWFHQEEDANTEMFCRQVLQSQVVQDALEDQLLLWAGDVSRFEPSQISRLLGLQSFPSLVLLQPVTNDFAYQCLEWPLGTFCTPLQRCQFAGDADVVLATVQMTLEDFRQEAQEVQEARSRRDVQLAEDRRLREQQDREFEEALLADQLQSIQREASPQADAAHADAADAEPDLEAQVEVEKAKAEEPKAAQEEEELRLKRRAEILAQPEPASGETARIRLQLPSGERLQRSFAASVALKEVYEWAHCCRPVATPKHFELCINFPARSLKDPSATLKELDLVPSAALVLKESD